MAHKRQVSSSEGFFNTALFAALLIAGAVIGAAVATHIIPRSHVSSIMGFVMLPLGVVLGVAAGSGAAPPLALLNLFSVFDGRNTVEEIIGRGGGTGGVLSLAVAIVIGTVIVCLVLAGIINVFVKPDATFGVLMTWFGGTGLAYGTLAAALTWFAASNQ